LHKKRKAANKKQRRKTVENKEEIKRKQIKQVGEKERGI
jgi:hypothetical protein